jgi:hypothetical protein
MRKGLLAAYKCPSAVRVFWGREEGKGCVISREKIR